MSVIAVGGYSYTLLSGVQIFVPKDLSFTNRIDMLIDLNGYNSPPNKMGRDAFYLMVVPELVYILISIMMMNIILAFLQKNHENN